jgi:hypothetical protein
MKSADGRFVYLDEDYEPVPPGTPPEEVHRFGFRCPRKGHMCEGLNLRGRGHDIPNKSWTWDGNVEAPTFSPSINCGGCGWHGFIEAGKLRDA